MHPPAPGAEPPNTEDTPCHAPSSAMPSTARPNGACSSDSRIAPLARRRRQHRRAADASLGPDLVGRARAGHAAARARAAALAGDRATSSSSARASTTAATSTESGLRVADFPFNTIFTKAPSCITAADAPVACPRHVQLLDYEIELGLVLRRELPAGTQVARRRPRAVAGGGHDRQRPVGARRPAAAGAVLQGQELPRLRPGRAGPGAADAARNGRAGPSCTCASRSTGRRARTRTAAR